ncbi:hypothetical protein BC629DRAFT_1596881 [Irpex lacteus]|nr:hypothetical protein BC629DRAFT_1596881 [Irpex lacteus]
MTTFTHDTLTLFGRKDANVPPDSFATDLSQVRMTIYMGFVSFSIVVWDHLVTFSDEVEYVWKGHKGVFVVLFLINRYLTPLGFIINLLGTDSYS